LCRNRQSNRNGLDYDSVIGSSFPVVYGGNNLLEVDLDANFSFPTIVQNISEVDVTDMNINHENQVVYQASKQILNATFLPIFAAIKKDQINILQSMKIYQILNHIKIKRVLPLFSQIIGRFIMIRKS
jgi:hypothetical protein